MTREAVQRFGPDDGLVGIYTEPSGTPHPHGLLFLNAGVIHRVGPHRMHVAMARRIASLGFHAFRFDSGGLGDSFRQRSEASSAARQLDEMIAACEQFQQLSGGASTTVFGLCSGADNALVLASHRSEVCRLVLIDPYVFPTLRSRMTHWRRQVLRPAAWRGFVLARVRRQRREPVLAPTESGDRYVRATPPAPEFAELLSRLIDRRVSINMIYTGSSTKHFNYVGQLDDAFRRYGLAGKVQVDYVPDFSHTFGEHHALEWLIARVAQMVAAAPAATAIAPPTATISARTPGATR